MLMKPICFSNNTQISYLNMHLFEMKVLFWKWVWQNASTIMGRNENVLTIITKLSDRKTYQVPLCAFSSTTHHYTCGQSLQSSCVSSDSWTSSLAPRPCSKSVNTGHDNLTLLSITANYNWRLSTRVMTILLSCQSLLITTDVCQHGLWQPYSPVNHC